ncbi:uncharacterized protein MYCGRDRAFT_101009 [Zymoseptoria tritici IPO323]|uniref:Transport protein particle component n=1 Tax=Zymoseptoria tritici (strain CBS 115943 / IPO323) TaxID=336722 RepID=F9XI11_ZYMTI|nr:uncharacterized protein MYCGRDRAFT_101009 [Zymoseptoria tritici IPO323]EGP85048.1 hypothetical protein MYCGRDRAFT_101009 [Zymoseptoria tritici IPO323]
MSTKPLPNPETDDLLSNPKVNASCLDFLLIELVPLAQRITDQLHAREQALIDDFRRKGARAAGTKPGSTQTATGPVPSALDDETREAMFWRLDGLGYRVGQGLVERFSINKPRPTTPLDAIKFICKDLWLLIFRKQIDNLKTNHRGVFVLTDNRFQPLSRMSVDRRAGPKAAEDALRRAQTCGVMQYLYFPCGIIRGALQGLGMDVTISAETTEIPAAIFQIKAKSSKS